jgi:hypothetical protein
VTAFDSVAARRWCESLVPWLAAQTIERDGLPYLERYFVAGWSPSNGQTGPAIFLHHFVASDAREQMHSHPWGLAVSLILVGGYREERCNPAGRRTAHDFRPGDVNVIAADDVHRIDLLDGDCWSLFVAGEFEKAWTFVPPCEVAPDLRCEKCDLLECECRTGNEGDLGGNY